MSRAINVSQNEAALTALCTKLGIGISTIEPLKSGGTRIVLNTSADAELMRSKLGNTIIKGAVERSAAYVGRIAD